MYAGLKPHLSPEPRGTKNKGNIGARREEGQGEGGGHRRCLWAGRWGRKPNREVRPGGLGNQRPDTPDRWCPPLPPAAATSDSQAGAWGPLPTAPRLSPHRLLQGKCLSGSRRAGLPGGHRGWMAVASPPLTKRPAPRAHFDN